MTRRWDRCRGYERKTPAFTRKDEGGSLSTRRSDGLRDKPRHERDNQHDDEHDRQDVEGVSSPHVAP